LRMRSIKTQKADIKGGDMNLGRYGGEKENQPVRRGGNRRREKAKRVTFKPSARGRPVAVYGTSHGGMWGVWFKDDDLGGKNALLQR